MEPTEPNGAVRNQFNSTTARMAGIISGAAKRARHPKTVADQALEDMLTLKSLLTSMLSVNKCDKCKREGPKVSEYVDIIKTLLSLNSEILNRIKGKAPTESLAQRFGSVSEYKKAAEGLEIDDETYIPSDLPPPPTLD